MHKHAKRSFCSAIDKEYAASAFTGSVFSYFRVAEPLLEFFQRDDLPVAFFLFFSGFVVRHTVSSNLNFLKTQIGRRTAAANARYGLVLYQREARQTKSRKGIKTSAAISITIPMA